MNIKTQKQFIFKDIKVEDGSFSFNVIADDEKSAKDKLKRQLQDIIKQL